MDYFLPLRRFKSKQMIADADLVRECVLTSLKMQTSFRQIIQRSLKSNHIGLTFEMLQILFCLWREEGINQQELANRTFKDKVSMSYLINNLEKKGLVRRESSPSDRRNKLIYLTPGGQQLRGIISPLLADIYASAGQKMEAGHIQATIRYLQELYEVFNKL